MSPEHELRALERQLGFIKRVVSDDAGQQIVGRAGAPALDEFPKMRTQLTQRGTRRLRALGRGGPLAQIIRDLLRPLEQRGTVGLIRAEKLRDHEARERPGDFAHEVTPARRRKAIDKRCRHSPHTILERRRAHRMKRLPYPPMLRAIAEDHPFGKRPIRLVIR